MISTISPTRAAHLERLARHYRPGAGWAEAFAGVLAELFAPEGLVLLDPRDPGSPRSLRPSIAAHCSRRGRSPRRWARAEERHRRCTCARALRSSSSTPRVPRGRGIGSFPRTAGGPRWAGRASTPRRSSSMPWTGGRCASAPARCCARSSQDTWLPTAAYVGGPAEVAYFAQLPPALRRVWPGHAAGRAARAVPPPRGQDAAHPDAPEDRGGRGGPPRGGASRPGAIARRGRARRQRGRRPSRGSIPAGARRGGSLARPRRGRHRGGDREDQGNRGTRGGEAGRKSGPGARSPGRRPGGGRPPAPGLAAPRGRCPRSASSGSPPSPPVTASARSSSASSRKRSRSTAPCGISSCERGKPVRRRRPGHSAPTPTTSRSSAAGSLIHLQDLGYATGVVDLTRGELSTHGSVDERAREAEAAAGVLGLSFRENLGLPDGFIGEDSDSQRTCTAWSRRCAGAGPSCS